MSAGSTLTDAEKEAWQRALDFYKIEDPGRQIFGYEQTYWQQISDRFYDFSTGSRVVIGEPKGHLGDNLYYTPLPDLVAKKGRSALVQVNPYSPWFFPAENLVEVNDDTAWGAHTEFGWGHAIQRKARALGIRLPDWRARVPVREDLVNKYHDQIRDAAGELPVIALHSTSKTSGSPLGRRDWNRMVGWLREAGFFVVQLGGPRDKKVKNCHSRFLIRDGIPDFIAIIKVADYFLGANSGPMHLAAALKKPSVIIEGQAPPGDIVLPVLTDNEFLPGRVNHHVYHLYPGNRHLHPRGEENPFFAPVLSRDNLVAAFNFGTPAGAHGFYWREDILLTEVLKDWRLKLPS